MTVTVMVAMIVVIIMIMRIKRTTFAEFYLC